MCGRLVLTSNYKEKIRAIFDSLAADEWLPPRYNITPGTSVPVVLDSAPDQLKWLAWGFPARQPNRPPLINARGETVHALPTFKTSFAQHRCLVLADGFYEWRRDPGRPRPQPYFFQRKEGAQLMVAGLWQAGPPGTCLVITTEANRLMHPIHDRMPALLDPEGARLWLNRETHPETLKAMLQPFPSDDMTCHPVSDRVNRATSEGEDLIRPVTIYEQGGLF